MKIRSHCHSLLLMTTALLLAACGGAKAPQGDVAHGKQLYAQCAGCHELSKNMAGPKHCGLMGRTAGSVSDYAYSVAMLDSGIVWNEKTLDEFLIAPIAYVNGTKMGFAGLTNPTDRADLIAYLREATSDPSICPPG